MLPSCCPLARWVIRGVVITAGLALAWLAFAPVHSQDADTATVLAKVPADAIGFVHIRAGKVWEAPMMAGFRDMVLKAGTPALEAFNKRFQPAPKTIDSIAFYVIGADEDHGPLPALLIGFSEPFDQAKVLKALLPGGVNKNHFGQRYIEDSVNDLAMKIFDAKTLMISQPKYMQALVTHQSKPAGAMARHVSAAAAKPLYAAIDMASIPADALEELPEPLQPLVKAKELVLTGEVGKELALKLQLRYSDAKAAGDADKAIREGLQMGRQRISSAIEEAEKRVTDRDASSALGALPEAVGQLMALAALKSMDEFFTKPPISKQGDALVMDYRFDPTNPQTLAMGSAFVWGTAVPSVTMAQAGKAKAKGQDNLKQIALAMHNYHTTYGHMPSAIYSKDGKKVLLSWRVALLPFLEQEKLYREFRLEEPWDSDHNKKLIEKMPDVFKDPEAPAAKEPGQTHYQIFVGGGAGFRMQTQGARLFDITDGSSNTIMIVTSTESATWTKPTNLVFDMSKPLPKLGLGGKPANVALFDGSVRTLNAKTGDRVLKTAITAAGGELMPEEW